MTHVPCITSTWNSANANTNPAANNVLDSRMKNAAIMKTFMSVSGIRNLDTIIPTTVRIGGREKQMMNGMT